MKFGKWSANHMRVAGFAILLVTMAVAQAAAPVLPCGPEQVKRFGAYQTKLDFTPEWDAPWRLGPHADVVVAFPDAAARLVFWHGANYVPCWVHGVGRWSSNGAVLRGAAGPHHDRLCRFSFATVQESCEARAVVRWRYAPVDEAGELIHSDPMTGWHDWVDEFYTFYPDATGVRSVTLHSSTWSQPISVQQIIEIRQPGAEAPSAAVCNTAAVPGGLLRWMDGEGGTTFLAVAGEAADITPPSSWGDWPARGSATKAGHGFAGAWQWQPFATTPTRKSWRMLLGSATREADRLHSTRSWLAPPALRVESGPCTSAGYQPDEKAYLLTTTKPGAAGAVRFTLAGSPSSPVANPAFVIKGWGRSAARLLVDGREVPSGADFRHGHRKTAAGSDLIVWVRANAGKTVTFEILTPQTDDEARGQ